MCADCMSWNGIKYVSFYFLSPLFCAFWTTCLSYLAMFLHVFYRYLHITVFISIHIHVYVAYIKKKKGLGSINNNPVSFQGFSLHDLCMCMCGSDNFYCFQAIALILLFIPSQYKHTLSYCFAWQTASYACICMLERKSLV